MHRAILIALAGVMGWAVSCFGQADAPQKPRSPEAIKALKDYEAAVKAAKFKYGQDLAKARQAVLARAAASTDPVAKDALHKEADAILAAMLLLKSDMESPKPGPKPKSQAATCRVEALNCKPALIGPVAKGEKFTFHIEGKWNLRGDRPLLSPCEGGPPMQVVVAPANPAKFPLMAAVWKEWQSAGDLVDVISQDATYVVKEDGYMVLMIKGDGHGVGEDTNNTGFVDVTITRQPPDESAKE